MPDESVSENSSRHGRPPKDLHIGSRFGRLTIIGFSHRPRYRDSIWDCKCDCGTERKIGRQSLVRGQSTACRTCMVGPPPTTKSARVRERRLSDPGFRNRIAYQKRVERFKIGIKALCTKAYLSTAKREEYRYAVALRRWIKQCKTERRLLEGFDPVEAKRATARENSKRRYWEDPEAHRVKSQSFKHSRPDYREEWNAKRGRLERELSDGTLTREAVERLFAGSSKCPYCGDCYEKSRRSLDHIVPLSKAAGRKLHSINNVLVCCFACNNKKRTKGLNQFLEELKASAKKNVSQPRTACRSVGLFAAHD